VVFLKRDIPKINGSSGGFIALVVVLIVVIIASCTAVFFLVRNSASSEGRYRQRSRQRYMSQSESTSSSYEYKNPDGDSQPPQTWKDKVGRIFRFGRRSGGAVGGGNGVAASGRLREGGGRRGRGWVQAGSGDEADSVEEGSRWNRAKGVRFAPPVRIPGSNGSHGSTDESFRPPARKHSLRNYSLELDLPGPMYDDPYSEALSPPPPSPYQPELSPPPAAASPSAAPTFHIPRSTSPESLPHSPSSPRTLETPANILNNNRHLSTQSGVSVRTFEGGTKFIESL